MRVIKKFFKLIGRAFVIRSKKQLLAILIITFVVDALAATYGLVYHHLYGDNLLLKFCDGLFVINSQLEYDEMYQTCHQQHVGKEHKQCELTFEDGW